MPLSKSDWNAIKWYAEQRDYTIRDMMAGPIVIYRNKDDKKVRVNINFIVNK